MDPELYRQRYLEPFRGDFEVAALPEEKSLIFLPDRCYYGEERLGLPLSAYSVKLDKLTREELQTLITEAGLGEAGSATPGSVLGMIREERKINEDRRVLLIEREKELESLRQDLDRVLNARSYQVYRKLLLPLRAVRKVWRTVGRGAGKGR